MRDKLKKKEFNYDDMALPDIASAVNPEEDYESNGTGLFLEKIDSISLNINNTIYNATMLAGELSSLWEATLQTAKAIKELDVIMKQMDISLAKYIIDSEVSLEKLRKAAPIIEKQLEDISVRLDKVLDKALSIDPINCSQLDIEFRSTLINQVRDWSHHISSLLMKMIGI